MKRLRIKPKRSYPDTLTALAGNRVNKTCLWNVMFVLSTLCHTQQKMRGSSYCLPVNIRSHSDSLNLWVSVPYPLLLSLPPVIFYTLNTVRWTLHHMTSAAVQYLMLHTQRPALRTLSSIPYSPASPVQCPLNCSQHEVAIWYVVRTPEPKLLRLTTAHRIVHSRHNVRLRYSKWRTNSWTRIKLIGNRGN